MDTYVLSHHIYTKVWLKCYGYQKSDGWWVVPPQHALVDLIKVLTWEVERSDWAITKSGAINVMIEWDGDMLGLFEECREHQIRDTLDAVGLCTLGQGWPELRHLSSDERFWIMIHLPEYEEMTKN